MVENVSAAEAWEALRSDPDARLVDVRTEAEWNFVGVPDLSELGKETLLVAWQHFPAMQRNGAFAEDLRRAGLTPAQRVYFICRSGARSLSAARLAEQAGFGRCFNLGDGFEGPHDAEGHRGTVAGWKAEGLPWRQG